MKELAAFAMLTASEHLERLNVLLDNVERPADYSDAKEIPPRLRRNISTSYDDIARAADVIGAPVTRIAAERAKRKLLGRKKPLNYKDLREINAEVQSRLHDELGTTRFYCMPPGAAEFYNPEAPLFGAEVEARIAKANDDIAEAGKCFATGRYTASVFHLMRAMEAAVQRLSAELGIRNINREWGKLLSDIGGKIENMPKGEKRDDWSQVHANLYHVKQAWRNDTMHPKATYTEEEAREVFEAMKAFMRKLASLLPTDLAEIMA